MKAHIFSVIVLITAGGLLPLFGQNIDIIVTDICGETSNGMITLEVLNGANPPFSIVWSNNDTEEIIAPTTEETQAGESEITNLESGTYCVEVISLMDECSAQSCNLIVESTPPLQITESISCICPNGFGAIDL